VVAALDNDAEDPIPEVVEAAMLRVEVPDLPALDVAADELTDLDGPPAD
jgi:hypothetical protein